MGEVDDDTSPPTAKQESLSGHAISGVVLLSASQGVKFVTQMLSTVLLARLLSPVDFGIFAMVMPIVAFVMMFQDFGLSQAVITVKAITHRQESSFFVINVGLSLILAAIILASAPLIARFYNNDAVIRPAIVLAGTVMLSGFSTLQFALLVRRLNFRAMAIADILGATAGLAASILIAFFHPSVWALVGAVVANMLAGLIYGWSATQWRPTRPAPFSEVRSLIAFGGGVASSDFMTFVSRNADNVLIGRYLGAAPLGFYDRAYKLLLFPLEQVVRPLGRVTVPILGRLIDEPDRYYGAYARTINQILLITTPGMAAMLVLADLIVPFVMGAKWAPVIPLFRWLGLVGLTIPLTQTFNWLLISQGRTRDLARYGIFNATTCIIGFIAGLRFGVIGVASIFASTEILMRVPVFIWRVGRKGPVSTRQIYALIGPHLLGGLGAAALCYFLRAALIAPPLVVMGLGAAASYSAAWAIVWLFPSRRVVLAEGVTIAARAVGPIARRIARRQPATPA